MKYLPCLLWIPLVLVKLLLALAGLFIVPLALATQSMGFHTDLDTEKHWPDIFWWWGNDEEHCPEWWLAHAAEGKAGKIAKWFPRFWWYAIRNPVNNLRFIFKDPEHVNEDTNWTHGDPMEAQQMLQHGQSVAWRYRWSGWMSGYRRVWLHSHGKYSEFWIGWKLHSSVPGLGFSMQYRRKREIGK